MSILVSNEILKAVCNELSMARDSVQIITAYCKMNSLEHLMQYITPEVSDKKIMIRFRLDDIVKGSTDFSVIEKCISEKWEVYIRFDLHAKTYIVDNKRGILGSANLTNSGLSISGHGNSEMATLIDIDDEDMNKISRLYRDAILVDENLLQKMRLQYEAVGETNIKETLTWSKEITALFRPKIDALFSHELPDVDKLENGTYISFLEIYYNGNKNELKEKLRWSNCYLWLLDTLNKHDGCMFFGAITAELHNVLVSDPKPYRKDVKVFLSNLLTIIELLGMSEIIVDRPNYSQRVRLTDMQVA